MYLNPLRKLFRNARRRRRSTFPFGSEQRLVPRNEYAAYAAKHGRVNAERHFLSIEAGGIEAPTVRRHKAARRRLAKASRIRNRR